MKFRLPTRL